MIIDALNRQLEMTRGASLDAASYATDSEAKADSKWDTQGLEASYLAAGQAAHVVELGEAIQSLKGIQVELEADGKKDVVEKGSLVSCEMNGFKCHFFVSDLEGGISVDCEGEKVTVITPQSPIAHQIIGRKAYDGFTMPNGGSGLILAVS